MNTEERIKALEEWQRRHVSTTIPILEDKIKALEANEKLTEKTENHIGERLLNLEEWRIHKDLVTDDLRKKTMKLEESSHSHAPSSSIPELENRIKELESWLDTNDIFTERVIKLEEWKQKEDTYTAKNFDGHLERIRKLEEWQRRHTEDAEKFYQDFNCKTRLEGIEAWKNHFDEQIKKLYDLFTPNVEINSRVIRKLEELEEWYDAHHERIMKLEEWKREHLHVIQHIPPTGVYITIPKEVWEEIKSIAKSNYTFSMSYKNTLKDEIQKVEPDWNPE